MGILDYQPDPIGQGLLGFGTALMTPRALGGGMAAGLNAFNANALQANQLKRQAQQDALREQLLQAQMQSYQSAAEDRKAQTEARRAEMAQKQQQAEAQRGVLSQFAGPPMGFRDASIAAGGTAPAGYTPPAKGGQITREMAAQWVAAGGDLATLKQLAESGNFGREEVARVLERRGADGTPEQVRESKYGDVIGAAVPKPFEMTMTDIGGSVVPVNPYAPTALTKTMTPDGVANDNRARQRIGLEQANSAKPVWDSARGAWVYRPTADAPNGVAVPAVGADRKPLAPLDVSKLETDLRKEFNDLPQTKKFINAAPAYNAIVDASTRNNKQADINLVYGLAKLYDPDSVVREGEYDTIARSQTIPEWLKGQAASLTGTGGKLTPATRAQILQEARGRLSSYETEYNAARRTYEGIATQRGANPQNVFVPITGVGGSSTQSGGAPADLREAARQEIARRNGGR